MPNYCDTYIRIDNLTPEQVQEFDAIFDSEKDVKLLRAFVPSPLDRKNDIDWYYDNWGTKWDIQEPDYTSYSNEGHIEISCWTAWSPPVTGFDTISKLFPNAVISLFYVEPGCDFTGKAMYKNGLLEEVEAEYSLLKLAWLEENHPELYEQIRAGGDDQEGLEEMADDLWIESDYYCYIEEYLDAQFSEDIKALLNNGEENNEDDLAPHQ
jgi:hypothetical protein